ncbi:hypothetical protein PBI_SCTP2_286 [Salicola phage SCTP-2]|nr:hypothetical protein PBI_SCTP2_286 [Salicola phage SCTP-2]
MYLNELKQLCEDNNIIMKRQTCFFSNKAPIMLCRISNFNNQKLHFWYTNFEKLKYDIPNFQSNYTYQLYFRYNTQDIIYYYFFNAINNLPNDEDSYVSLNEKIYNCNEINNTVLPKLNESKSFDIVLKINAVDKEYLKSFASQFNKLDENSIKEDELVNIRNFETNMFYSCFIYIKQDQFRKIIKHFKLAGDSIIISDVIYSNKFCDIDIVKLVDIIPPIGKVKLNDFLAPSSL